MLRKLDVKSVRVGLYQSDWRLPLLWMLWDSQEAWNTSWFTCRLWSPLFLFLSVWGAVPSSLALLSFTVDSWFECSIEKYLIQTEEAKETEVTIFLFWLLIWFLCEPYGGAHYLSSPSSAFCLCPSSSSLSSCEVKWLVPSAIIFSSSESGIIWLWEQVGLKVKKSTVCFFMVSHLFILFLGFFVLIFF